MIQNINKSCLGTGLIFGIWDVNMLCIAYEYRFDNTLINPPTQLFEPTSPMILSASIPFSLLQLKELPTVSYVETKKQRPSRHMLHALIHAYSLNDKVCIDKYRAACPFFKEGVLTFNEHCQKLGIYLLCASSQVQQQNDQRDAL